MVSEHVRDKYFTEDENISQFCRIGDNKDKICISIVDSWEYSNHSLLMLSDFLARRNLANTKFVKWLKLCEQVDKDRNRKAGNVH